MAVSAVPLLAVIIRLSELTESRFPAALLWALVTAAAALPVAVSYWIFRRLQDQPPCDLPQREVIEECCRRAGIAAPRISAFGVPDERIRVDVAGDPRRTSAVQVVLARRSFEVLEPDELRAHFLVCLILARAQSRNGAIWIAAFFTGCLLGRNVSGVFTEILFSTFSSTSGLISGFLLLTVGDGLVRLILEALFIYGLTWGAMRDILLRADRRVILEFGVRPATLIAAIGKLVDFAPLASHGKLGRHISRRAAGARVDALRRTDAERSSAWIPFEARGACLAASLALAGVALIAGDWFLVRKDSRALAEAIEAGDLPRLEELRKSGIGLDARIPVFAGHRFMEAASRPWGRYSPLIMAVRLGRDDSLRWLLEHGADPARSEAHGEHPLADAVERRDHEAVNLLLNHGADPREENDFGESACSMAIRNGDIDSLPSFFTRGLSVDESVGVYNFNNGRPDEFLWRTMSKKVGAAPIARALARTPLSLAAGRGQRDVAVWLLAHGAQIDHINADGMTPLMLAARGGQTPLATLLLERGAVPDKTDPMGRTALMYAAAAGNQDVVRVLLDAGSNPNIKSSANETALSLALKKDHAQTAALLRGGQH
jgi:ankyrin repeat protein